MSIASNMGRWRMMWMVAQAFMDKVWRDRAVRLLQLRTIGIPCMTISRGLVGMAVVTQPYKLIGWRVAI
jgi:hypothetical protein